MKAFSLRALTLIPAFLLLSLSAGAVPQALVKYSDDRVVANPPRLPHHEEYTLTITAPNSPALAGGATIGLVIESIERPLDVSPETANAMITFSSQSLLVSGANAVITVTVYVDLPAEIIGGAYKWKVTTSGWLMSVTDRGHGISGVFTATPIVDESLPVVILDQPLAADLGAVFKYDPTVSNGVDVPVHFIADVVENGQPITSVSAAAIDAFGNETAVVFSPAPNGIIGLETNHAVATGLVRLSAAGIYVISAVAENQFGTSSPDAKEITVAIAAPPPTITVASPISGSAGTYTLGTSSGISVPVSFAVNSPYGDITLESVTAKYDATTEVPLTLISTHTGTANQIVASGSVPNVGAGSHTIVFNASNAYGPAAPVSVTFSVTGKYPNPTVSILTPTAGYTVTRAAGDPATVVNYSFAGSATYGNITSVVVTVDGVAVSPAASVTGLNTPSISGSGALSYSGAGTHTIGVTVKCSGGAFTAESSATTETSFTITQTQSQTCKDLTWLPPICLNKTIEGGSMMPIKFRLDCHGEFVRDTEVRIVIYEVFGNPGRETYGPETIYPYGKGSPNPKEYAITGKMYHLNFDTAKGAHHYRIDVFSTATGVAEFIGSKDLYTKGK